jgi:hypothetical protein
MKALLNSILSLHRENFGWIAVDVKSYSTYTVSYTVEHAANSARSKRIYEKAHRYVGVVFSIRSIFLRL